jgi:hypothetical protein
MNIGRPTQMMAVSLIQASFKNKLAKSAPPRHLNIHVSLPRNVLLLYSDCCVDTYYPDNFD